MAGAQPACFAVEFNCYKVGISGTIDEVVAEWSRFDHTTVVKMHIVHCPALEVPEMFQEFTRLREIWVYNSTVRDWGPEASFTNSCHPHLTVLSLVRTNMTDMLLPLDFQDEDFPANLSLSYFCETNLRTLPDDLDEKWNLNSNIYIENSELTTVPLSLVRLQPYYLSLAGNPIRELPPELFETPEIQYLIVSSLNVEELPRNVTQPPPRPAFYDFSHTNIAFFWSWMDLFVENARGIAPRIVANAIPYCSDLDKIFSGILADFSTPFQSEYSKLLMNASKTNWDFLRQAVDCTPRAASTQFPLEFWDNLYGML
ncbi:hypothetical protein PHYSODRAFT_495165 [Phytophthora sojae]|uniref:Uncharacterized protein n=1 Tax=Phytophthora sojae (strain P6497) TaxID=1094619 RepID=G4Z301_PHYSP|nr:hypothetical protein PHYSODRAFT_495165 [Phytophthora sojae]EGZ19334.1 hypothetical protein PHYSODRAFT_495165 [Phytophthora sojae]|eukprot:XP_009522051.1 hypothetical protein PHYSODRAFT_495165 [Phytophthora sojae]